MGKEQWEKRTMGEEQWESVFFRRTMGKEQWRNENNGKRTMEECPLWGEQWKN